jgi:hypothetical protein
MTSRSWLVAAILLVLAGESWILARKAFPPALSTEPVLVWPAEGHEDTSSPEILMAIRLYGADRGRKANLLGSREERLTAFYFEWDRAEMGPLLGISAHTPEVCNVASGMDFLGQGQLRRFRFPDGKTLEFDTTSFATPDGSAVWVFKCVWMQGKGSLTLRRSHDRKERLIGSFVRHAGAARVIQAGVFGIKREEDAWAFFIEEVLENLIWEDSSDRLDPATTP